MEIIIIGCGLAGLSAAVSAAENHDQVTLVAPYGPERAQSVLAAGGINAAMNTAGEDDDPLQHAADTIEEGRNLTDEEAVRQMTAAAPSLIRKLADLGVAFSRDKDGSPAMRYFGGQKKKRTVYAKAGIGKQLVSGLSGVFLRECAEGKICFLENRKFLQYLETDGRYAGIIVENILSGELEYLTSDALIIASGGPGGLFGRTTGSALNDGSAAASLYVSGMQMANLEMIQYHPTTIETNAKRMLISEAARGEGGRLFTVADGKRWYFMEDWYGPRGNLMPRDVVSQSIYKVCVQMKKGIDGEKKVGLDLTHLKKEVLENRLKEVLDTSRHYLNIDPEKDYIPVYPGIHYFMGGIYTDRKHRTSVPGIYAAGECACIYHGANRLGGNSTLGAIYGGITAVKSADADWTGQERSTNEEKAQEIIRKLNAKCQEVSGKQKELPAWIIQDIQIAMNLHLGILRSPEEMKEGIRVLREISSREVLFRKRHISDALAALNLQQLGIAFFESALYRKESRGAHMRMDYPERDDLHCRMNSVAVFREGRTVISMEEIGGLFR